MLGDLELLLNDVVLIPPIFGFAVELGTPWFFRVDLDRENQVPEVGADRKLGEIHAKAGIFANLAEFASDQWEQVVAVGCLLALDWFQSEGRYDGREKIDGLDDAVMAIATAPAAGEADNQGRVNQFLVQPRAESSHEAVLAERLALVAGEYDIWIGSILPSRPIARNSSPATMVTA